MFGPRYFFFIIYFPFLKFFFRSHLRLEFFIFFPSCFELNEYSKTNLHDLNIGFCCFTLIALILHRLSFIFFFILILVSLLFDCGGGSGGNLFSVDILFLFSEWNGKQASMVNLLNYFFPLCFYKFLRICFSYILHQFCVIIYQQLF